MRLRYLTGRRRRTAAEPGVLGETSRPYRTADSGQLVAALMEMGRERFGEAQQAVSRGWPSIPRTTNYWNSALLLNSR